VEQISYEYDVVFSFAGSDREVAEILGSIARANGLRVFIDKHHAAESWGKNLPEYLGEIYDSKSRFCVMLISREYIEKPYTKLERRRAMDRALESEVEYILPVRLDDSSIEGLPRSTAYLDLREMSSVEVGKLLVQKIKGTDAQVIVPDGIQLSKFERLHPAANDSKFAPRAPQNTQLIEFVEVHPTEDAAVWKITEPQRDTNEMFFRESGGTYQDPIFDVTIISRHDKPILLTAVGIEVVWLGSEEILLLGGGAASVIRDKTYKVPLPDLWEALALKQRESGVGQFEKVEVNELAYCRLPDPILIESYGVYRFGLHLLDFVMHCPNSIELFFWARTDRGEMRSGLAHLSYLIGGQIAPYMRYLRILSGESKPVEDIEMAR